VLPAGKYVWAFHDWSEDQYEIDGDTAAYRMLKYAAAVLADDPNVMVYVPARKNPGIGTYYGMGLDAVLLRPELQFRRSEWVRLRRQLDAAHRVERYVLNYEPERLCARLDVGDRAQRQALWHRLKRREAQEVNGLLGETVFMVCLRESWLYCHNDIVDVLRNLSRIPRDDSMCVSLLNFDLGWVLTPGGLGRMKQKAKAQAAQARRERETRPPPAS